MLKQISTLFIILFASLIVAAQNEKASAPVKWERYKVGIKDVSILLPKLPILIQDADLCFEQETNKYAAYAEGIVYGLNITYRSGKDVPEDCSNKKNFDEDSFRDGIIAVKTFLKTEQETRINLKNLEIVKIKGERFTYWLIDDFKNKRWFELWVTTEDEENQTVKNFLESAKFGENLPGIEIGKGSDRTLGDEPLIDKSGQEKNTVKSDKENKEKTAVVDAAKVVTDIKSNKDAGEKYRLVLRPRANYTDAAREAQTTGTVRVKVTLLSSGGIGAISVVESLPFGLTEQAIAAARRIVFIPANRNKIFYTVVVTVEYTFSIY